MMKTFTIVQQSSYLKRIVRLKIRSWACHNNLTVCWFVRIMIMWLDLFLETESIFTDEDSTDLIDTVSSDIDSTPSSSLNFYLPPEYSRSSYQGRARETVTPPSSTYNSNKKEKPARVEKKGSFLTFLYLNFLLLFFSFKKRNRVSRNTSLIPLLQIISNKNLFPLHQMNLAPDLRMWKKRAALKSQLFSGTLLTSSQGSRQNLDITLSPSQLTGRNTDPTLQIRFVSILYRFLLFFDCFHKLKCFCMYSIE